MTCEICSLKLNQPIMRKELLLLVFVQVSIVFWGKTRSYKIGSYNTQVFDDGATEIVVFDPMSN